MKIKQKLCSQKQLSHTCPPVWERRSAVNPKDSDTGRYARTCGVLWCVVEIMDQKQFGSLLFSIM